MSISSRAHPGGPGRAGRGRQDPPLDAYLHKMEEALEGRDRLVGEAFSMADIAMPLT